MSGGLLLVLGGGVAGSAAATLLARGRARVMLVEQSAEARHKVCGEFLSAEACESLETLGLDVRALGAAPVRRLRLAGRGRAAEHDLPFAAWSLTRCVLDEAMLRMAAESGVEVRRGLRVEALDRDGGAWRVRMSGGETLRAGDVFVASGKHDLRGHARPQGVQGSLIAFKQYFRLEKMQRAELDEAIELFLFRGGYAGLQMVEGGCANFCLLVEARRYKEVGGRWEALLGAMCAESEHLRRRLDGARPMLERPLSLSRIPYGFLRRGVSEPGLWHLGDQMAVIPSFSGDGMSIALHTARVGAGMYLQGAEPGAFTKRMSAELGGLMWRATALSRMMVSPSGRRLVWGAVAACPSLLPRAAALTRIPAAARAKLSNPVIER